MILLYNSLILSHVNYCILTWGYRIDTLFHLQKRAVRIIANKNYLSHSESIFKDLKLLKFKDIFEKHKIKFFYRYSHNDIPDYFKNFDFKLRNEIHSYDTRHKNDLHSIKVNTEYAKKCIRYDIPNFINSLDDSLKARLDTHNLKSILNYHKNLKILGYTFECTDDNCYSCFEDLDDMYILNLENP